MKFNINNSKLLIQQKVQLIASLFSFKSFFLIVLFCTILLIIIPETAFGQNKIKKTTSTTAIEKSTSAIDSINNFGSDLLKALDKGDKKEALRTINNMYSEDLQTETRGYASQLTGIEDLALPPIETFLASVENNGAVLQKDDYKEELTADYKITKNEWMTYIQFHAYYAYGYYTYMKDYYTETIPANTTTAQQNWNFGINLSFSLADLINRKYRLKSAKAKVANAEHMRNEVIENRKLQILTAYNSILENLAALKPRAEAVALYNAQMKVSENDFINGATSIIALSLERQRRSSAIVQYQQGRVALHNAIRTLELLTNIPIIKE